MGGCCCSSRKPQFHGTPMYYYYPPDSEENGYLTSNDGVTSILSSRILIDLNLNMSTPDTYRSPPAPIPYEKDAPFLKKANFDFLKSKPTVVSEIDEEDVCPTCLEEYDAENPKVTTKCNHHFHLSCILEWNERSDTCPICDQEMAYEATL